MSSSSTFKNIAPPASEQLCYIHCNFCNIVLAVSVPCSSLFDTVTVRCGNCSSLWPVNVGMAAVFHQSLTGSTSSFQDSSSYHHQQVDNPIVPNDANLGLSWDCNNTKPGSPLVTNAKEINNRPPEKRQRIPSLYNQFIREEIQRIKASKPNICHKEAFSTAAKNWAHFPHIHFGLKLENNNHQANHDEDQGLRNLPNDKA